MTKGYKHATADQQKDALEAYHSSLSVGQAALTTGLSRNQVRTILRRHGVALSRSKNGACYRNIDSVRRWAAEGVSFSEIGRRIGTTSSKVSAFLKKHQIERKRFRQEGPNNPSWKGGHVLDKDGYVLVYAPWHPHKSIHNQVREHRLVMEEKLGRYLEPGEVVHHKDDNRQNNHPDNLELFSSNGEHLAATRKGKAPNISPEGWERWKESRLRYLAARRNASRQASSSGDPPSPDSGDQT